jgi:hypothetical protein
MTRLPETERTKRFRTESLRAAVLATERPHLLEHELAQRWRLSVRTLQRWRRAGSGPVFLRLGRRVAYRHSDVEHFEMAHVRAGGRS